MKRLFGSARRTHITTEQLSAYLDDQVTAVERARIEMHLRTCEACQRELNSLNRTVALLQALPRISVPRAFTLSEAQVGIRHPASYPVWLGGALRGMAAVTAIVLVAVIAVSVMRPSLPTKPSTLARVAPTTAVQPQIERSAEMAEEVPGQAAPAAPAAPAPAMALQAQETPVEKAETADEAQMQPEMLPAPPRESAPPAPEQKTAAEAESEAPMPAPALAAVSTEAASARSIAPAVVQAEKVAPMAEEPSALAVAPSAADETPKPLAETPSEESPEASAGMLAEPSAGAMGRGGGEPGTSGIESFTPEPTPPGAPITDILSPADGIAYVAQDGLWVIDDDADEPRLLAQNARGTVPTISPDRRWVFYRVFDAHNTELWAARWDGEQVRLLLTEQDLPKGDLGKDYAGRRIQDVRWIPGEDRLAITTMALPSESQTPPRFELWTLDVVSGTLRHVLDLRSAQYPIYAPDGQQFALFEFGTEQELEGRLVIFDADGTGRREVLRVPELTADASYRVKAQWLPDDDGLLAAIPAAGRDVDSTLMTIYRIGSDGERAGTGQLEAMDLFWSPDGKQLTYLSPGDEEPEALDLMLANGDGTDPVRYTSLQMGNLLSWAPDGRHFLYLSAGQIYLGSTREEPQALGNVVSIHDPRWLTSGRIIYLMNQGADWVLASRDLAGQTVSLTRLPKDVSYDTTTQR